jgi:hypothetical protein
VFDAMREDWRWLADAKFTKGSLAYVLQLAIEHGLVSPPCYCGRIQSLDNRAVGPVLKLDTGEVILWAPGSEPVNVVLEHWKGQTE